MTADPATTGEVTHWCVMCPFETTDREESYEHDCMDPDAGASHEFDEDVSDYTMCTCGLPMEHGVHG